MCKGGLEQGEPMQDGSRAALAISLAFLMLHLVLGALIPLIGDEGYYRLWASGLDWDYYDHPPMIAAMIRAGITVFGDGPLGVRVVPLLGMAVASLGVADMARSCAVSQVRAVLYFNTSLLVLAVGGFATPDAPSTLFWVLSSAAALRATGGQGRRWWVLAGLAAGLGIMSKFTNLFLGVGFVGWLVFTRNGRGSLRGWGPWLAIVAALVPVVPLLLWNLSHDGLGFQRQFGRIAGNGGYTARHLVEYLAMLVILPGPMIGLFALRRDGRQVLLLWTLAPLVTYFAVHALHAQVQANWLVPMAPVVAVLAAGVTMRWHGWILGGAAAFSGLILALAFNPFGALGVTDNPANQVRGWPALLAQIPDGPWIATSDYALTGQLFSRLPGRQIWAVTDLQRYGFRGRFPADLCNAPGLLIEEDHADHAVLFTTAGPVVALARVSGDKLLQRYHLRHVQGVKNPALCP